MFYIVLIARVSIYFCCIFHWFLFELRKKGQSRKILFIWQIHIQRFDISISNTIVNPRCLCAGLDSFIDPLCGSFLSNQFWNLPVKVRSFLYLCIKIMNMWIHFISKEIKFIKKGMVNKDVFMFDGYIEEKKERQQCMSFLTQKVEWKCGKIFSEMNFFYHSFE